MTLLALLLTATANVFGDSSSDKPRIVAGPGTTLILCWFVEDDGHGHHGYAAQDRRLDSFAPSGGGLFQTLDEFRAALHTKFAKVPLITDENPGSVPVGWKIRGLTAKELKELR